MIGDAKGVRGDGQRRVHSSARRKEGGIDDVQVRHAMGAVPRIEDARAGIDAETARPTCMAEPGTIGRAPRSEGPERCENANESLAELPSSDLVARAQSVTHGETIPSTGVNGAVRRDAVLDIGPVFHDRPENGLAREGFPD